MGILTMARNAQGSGTIRRYSENLWQARITIGRDPGTGKQKQKSIYGKTQAEVRKKMTAPLAELDKRTYIEPQKTTVKDWFTQWLDVYCKGTLKPYTLDVYTHASERMKEDNANRMEAYFNTLINL